MKATDSFLGTLNAQVILDMSAIDFEEEEESVSFDCMAACNRIKKISRNYKEITGNLLQKQGIKELLETYNILVSKKQSVIMKYITEPLLKIINRTEIVSIHKTLNDWKELYKKYQDENLAKIILSILLPLTTKTRPKFAALTDLPGDLCIDITNFILKYESSSDFLIPGSFLALQMIETDHKFQSPDFAPHKSQQYLPEPLLIFKRPIDYEPDDILFECHCVIIASAIYKILSNRIGKITLRLAGLLTKFLSFSDATRGAFCYVLYLSTINSTYPNQFNIFLNNMSNETGVVLMEQLFLYNTLESFKLLLQTSSQQFYSLFNRHESFIEKPFYDLTKQISLGFFNESAELDNPDKYMSKTLYLFHNYIGLICFKEETPDVKRHFILKNIFVIIDRLYYIRNFLFQTSFLIDSGILSMMLPMLKEFFDLLSSLIYEREHFVSPIQGSIVESTLLCLLFVLSAQIPNYKLQLTYNAIQAYESILNFISLNKPAFWSDLSSFTRPSLFAPSVIAASISGVNLQKSLEFLRISSFSTSPEVITAAYRFAETLPGQSETAAGLLGLFFSLLYEAYEQTSNASPLTIRTYLYLLSGAFRSPVLCKEARRLPIFEHFLAEIVDIYTSQKNFSEDRMKLQKAAEFVLARFKSDLAPNVASSIEEVNDSPIPNVVPWRAVPANAADVIPLGKVTMKPPSRISSMNILDDPNQAL